MLSFLKLKEVETLTLIWSFFRGRRVYIRTGSIMWITPTIAYLYSNTRLILKKLFQSRLFNQKAVKESTVK